MEILGIVQVVPNAHSQAEGAYQSCPAAVVGLGGHPALLRPGTEDCGETLAHTAQGISAQPKMCSPRRLRSHIAEGRGRLLGGRAIWMSL